MARKKSKGKIARYATGGVVDDQDNGVRPAPNLQPISGGTYQNEAARLGNFPSPVRPAPDLQPVSGGTYENQNKTLGNYPAPQRQAATGYLPSAPSNQNQPDAYSRAANPGGGELDKFGVVGPAARAAGNYVMGALGAAGDVAANAGAALVGGQRKDPNGFLAPWADGAAQARTDLSNTIEQKNQAVRDLFGLEKAATPTTQPAVAQKTTPAAPAVAEKKAPTPITVIDRTTKSEPQGAIRSSLDLKPGQIAKNGVVISDVGPRPAVQQNAQVDQGPDRAMQKQLLDEARSLMAQSQAPGLTAAARRNLAENAQNLLNFGQQMYGADMTARTAAGKNANDMAITRMQLDSPENAARANLYTAQAGAIPSEIALRGAQTGLYDAQGKAALAGIETKDNRLINMMAKRDAAIGMLSKMRENGIEPGSQEHSDILNSIKQWNTQIGALRVMNSQQYQDADPVVRQRMLQERGMAGYASGGEVGAAIPPGMLPNMNQFNPQPAMDPQTQVVLGKYRDYSVMANSMGIQPVPMEQFVALQHSVQRTMPQMARVPAPQGMGAVQPQAFAQGGQVHNAIPVAGREIEGPGTGTSDSVPAVIDGERPAALSDGEFVWTNKATESVGSPVLSTVMKAIERGDPGVISGMMALAAKAHTQPKQQA